MKILQNLGLHSRRFTDPNGENNRKPQVIIEKRPGTMVHVFIKKVGKIPDVKAGVSTARGSEQAKRSRRRKTRAKQTRIGYTYLHSAIDGNTRLAYTEARDNETAATAIDFMNNARAFFAAQGISRIERIITDNGSCYLAEDFTDSLRESQHYRIRPITTRYGPQFLWARRSAHIGRECSLQLPSTAFARTEDGRLPLTACTASPTSVLHTTSRDRA